VNQQRNRCRLSIRFRHHPWLKELDPGNFVIFSLLAWAIPPTFAKPLPKCRHFEAQYRLPNGTTSQYQVRVAGMKKRASHL
jgi:hypothetical protein